ncbi:MAG: glycosyl hydrolase [Coriobacteriia bacterium]|nr:glycosyl hydrolase [Coriobacteriia bacterium]
MIRKPRSARRAQQPSSLRAVRAFIALALVLAALGLAGTSASGRASIALAETTPTVGETSSSPEPTGTEASDRPLAGRVSAPSRGAYIGVFRPPAPYQATALSAYKTLSGKSASIVMWFQPWAPSGAGRFDAASAIALWNRGAVPLISWEPWNPGDQPHNLKTPSDMPAWTLAKIGAGDYDAYLTQFARDVKAAGGPVMISPFHEMNGCWYPWCGLANGNSPAQFVTAWRHVHDLFEREGATNVTWVWSVNFESRPALQVNRFAAYYPGPSYVDWVGVSGFNWGGMGGGPWRSFDKIYKTPLSYLKTTHKPVVITEIASVENKGSKAHWLTDTFKRIRTRHPEIKAVIYYDALEHGLGHKQDWRINSSKKSLAAYRAAVKPSAFIGSTPAALSQWRARLTSEQWVGLFALRRY